MDTFASASVNLYKVIKLSEFVKILNNYFEESFPAELVKSLLLPKILKVSLYAFSKDYLIHIMIYDDLSELKTIIAKQEGKPRYLPDKEEFAKSEDEWYDDHDCWDKAFDYLLKTFGPKPEVFIVLIVIKVYLTRGNDPTQIGEILENHDLYFDNSDRFEEFYKMSLEAYNHFRIWENNGHTPKELYKRGKVESEKNTFPK
ncbi:MAG: hypothetical protein PHG08_02965 [Bacilli bacterium]|nr:hypothetical protein [Bacilli bacterium]HHU24278.1 hypothetical protein [Acholeplasmataceae bacterium]